MAYATLQDIFLRWGETNVRDAANLNADNPRSAIVTRRIKYFLEMQSHEIDARLRGCAYKVPFDPVPPVIRTICAEMAYIAMYRVKHSKSQSDPPADPFMYVTAKHKQIFADIHARRFRLGVEEHTVDIPVVVGAKPLKIATATPLKKKDLAKNHVGGRLHKDSTGNNPLGAVLLAHAEKLSDI
jgi:phage gp36-like protein